MKRRIPVFTLFMFLILLGVTVFSVYYSYNTYHTTVKIEKKQRREAYFIGRMELNDLITRMCLAGNYRNSIAQFFDTFTHNRMITEAILSNAIVNEVPIMLSFALVSRESQFSPRAIGKNNNSADYGLWQLNSITFYKLTEKQMYDPMTNSNYGARYLRAKYDEQLRWEKAILVYNCGHISRVSETTLNYLCDILKLEEDYSNSFIRKFLF